MKDSAKELCKQIAVYALVFGVPTIIGLSFGYAAWLNGQRYFSERAVDKSGVPVIARIVSAPIPAYPDTVFSPLRLDCVVKVEYAAPGHDRPMLKTLNFWGDVGPCNRHGAGDRVPGKMLQSDPSVMALDETRLEARSFWSRFIGFCILTGLPLLVLLIGLLQYLHATFRHRPRGMNGA